MQIRHRSLFCSTELTPSLPRAKTSNQSAVSLPRATRARDRCKVPRRKKNRTYGWPVLYFSSFATVVCAQGDLALQYKYIVVRRSLRNFALSDAWWWGRSGDSRDGFYEAAAIVQINRKVPEFEMGCECSDKLCVLLLYT